MFCRELLYLFEQQGKKLLDAPLAEKQVCSIQTNNRGWTGMHTETLDPKNQRVRCLVSPLFIEVSM